MDTPLLSVCLITYNHINYIREAIESVWMQEINFSWEFIIADDYSIDGTREIVFKYKEKYPELIRIIPREKNVGAAKNWIELLTPAKGKYIAYFEGDDYWIDPNKLQKQIDFLEANPKYVCHCHNALIIEKNKPEKFYNNNKIDKVLTTDDIVTTLSIPTGSVVFRNCLRPFPSYLKKFPLDIILYFALSKFGDFYQSTEVMSVYRIHEGGIWSEQSPLKKLNENIKIKRFYLNEMSLNQIQKRMVKQSIVNVKLNRLKFFANTQFLSYNYFQDFIYLLYYKCLLYKFSLKFFIFCICPDNFIKLFKK
jgi:glycosyltransferase involved in cell wall biosynthesis